MKNIVWGLCDPDASFETSALTSSALIYEGAAASLA